MKALLSALLLSNCFIIYGQIRLTPEKINALDSIATQDVPAEAPGIATAIVSDRKTIYEKCAGFADLEDSVLISRKTRFNIASNGKQFTALAILTLIEEGKLRLTDDMRTFFPTLYPLIKDTISVQSLLNHTSGIRDCYDLWSLQGYTWWKETFSNADVLRLIEKQEDLNFEPNTRYLYSNTNYILLALIVEKVSGKRFVDYTNEIFRALKMPNTSFEDDYTRIGGEIARAYFNFDKWTSFKWISNLCGDGNIFSTLEDQIQWEKIIQGTDVPGIKRSIIAASQQPIEGSGFSNYGYGLEFGRYKGQDYRFHEGATGAWKATVTRFPGKRTAILTLTNTGKSIPSMQTRQMADQAFELKADTAYLVTRPSKVGTFVSDDDIIGTYLTDGDYAFQFERRDNKMFLKRAGRNDVELEREADNIYHQKNDPAFRQEFTMNANGDLQVTAYYINHSPYTLTKQDANFSSFDFQSLNGRYENRETGTIIEISYTAGKSYKIKIGSGEVRTGLLVTPEKILINNYSINFKPTNQAIDSLYLNRERIKQVKFVRKSKPA